MAATVRSVAASRTRSGASRLRTARRLPESTILSIAVPLLDHDLVERVLDDSLTTRGFQLRNQVTNRPLFDDRVHGDPRGVAQRGHRRPLQRRQQRDDYVEIRAPHI